MIELTKTVTNIRGETRGNYTHCNEKIVVWIRDGFIVSAAIPLGLASRKKKNNIVETWEAVFS